MTCLLLASLLATPAESFAAGQYADYLTTVAPSFTRDLADARLGPRRMIEAAIAVDALGDERWSKRLFPHGGRPAEVFALHRRLLRGDLSAVPELLAKAGGPGQAWLVQAEVLAGVAKTAKEPARYQTAGTALRLLGVLFPGAMPEQVQLAVADLQWAPAEPRDKLADVIVDLAAREQSGWSVRAIRAHLLSGIPRGRLKDPFLCDLALRLLPRTEDKLALAEALLGAGQQTAALQAGRAVLAAHPADVRVIRAVGGLLLHAGEDAEALKLFRQAASTLPYPERRTVRLGLLNALRGDCPTCPGGRRQPVPGVPTWDEEKTARLRQVEQHPDDLDGRLAMADTFLTERKLPEAANAYLGVLQEAREPGWQWAAWVGLAEADPAAAWGQVEKLPQREGTAEVTALAALAAGEFADGAKRTGQDRAGAQWAVVLYALAGDAVHATTADKSGAGTVDLLLDLLRARLPLVASPPSPLLRGAAESKLEAMGPQPAVWSLACELATAAVPKVSADRAAEWWKRLVLAARADDQAAPTARLTEAGARRLVTASQAEAKVWLDAATEVVRRGSRTDRLAAVQTLAESCPARLRAPTGWASLLEALRNAGGRGLGGAAVAGG
ncbi:MAG: hypothetical protein HYU66_23405 [Armatimonadetes bacterium]|nr:hypothetical protein [Armatimonadota bacterium]